MSAGGVFMGQGDAVMYDNHAALAYRWGHGQPDGLGRVIWTGGVEAGRFLGVDKSECWGLGAPVVVDDFGSLVRVH